MKNNTFKTIKHWDQDLMHQHIHKELLDIYSALDLFKIKNLSFIDIGANVGKFYEEISKRYEVNKCEMVEASPLLCEYLQNKFLNDPKVIIHNLGLSDTSGDFYFEDRLEHIEHNNLDQSENDVNLGLSKKTNQPGRTKFYNAGYYLREINKIPPNEISLIKIDTENADYQIVSAMKEFMVSEKINPIILFENNFHNGGNTIEWAQEIINDVCEKCKYTKPSLNSDNVILIPAK